MLNSLVIKNFRMLEDFTVEKLGRVNLIVGKNNSGKSTVLEALRIYAGNANRELMINIAENHDEIIKAYELDEIEFSYEELFTDRQYFNKKIFIAEFEECEKFIVINDGILATHQSMKNETTPCGFIPTQFISMDELERGWNAINLTDNEEIIIQALQIILPDFKRLAFDWDDSKRWVKVKLANLSKPVPLKSLGDGMLRILQIAIKLVSAQGGFLLIDEFENGLHYSVQENVWRLLFEMAEKLDIQVFATTHSWDCVRSFNAIAMEKENIEAVLFRMGRSALNSNKDQVIATVFDKEKLSRMTESDIEVR